MRVLVQGPGAIGRLIASRMMLQGVEVTLLDYRPERARELEAEGIRLETRKGSTERVLVPVIRTSDPLPVPSQRWDLLVSCVKAYDTARAIPDGVKFLDENGFVLVLSNGLGNLEIAEEVWPEGHCLGGALVCGAQTAGRFDVQESGVSHRSAPRSTLRLGARKRLQLDAQDLARIAGVFDQAGFGTERVEDGIEAVLWQKVAINCAVNPLGAILRVENGILPELPAFSAGVAAATETAAVARSRGISLPREGWGERVTSVCRATAKNRCSMLVDLTRGSRTEIDALCGRVTELGRQEGIATPWNVSFAQWIRSLEQTQRKNDPDSGCAPSTGRTRAASRSGADRSRDERALVDRSMNQGLGRDSGRI